MTNRSAGAGRDGSRLRDVLQRASDFDAVLGRVSTLGAARGHVCDSWRRLKDAILALAVPDPLASETGQGVPAFDCLRCQGTGVPLDNDASKCGCMRSSSAPLASSSDWLPESREHPYSPRQEFELAIGAGKALKDLSAPCVRGIRNHLPFDTPVNGDPSNRLETEG